MQIVLWNRDTLSGAVTIQTPSVDVQGVPVINMTVTVHGVAGTSPSVDFKLQTSDDLETWADIGTAHTVNSTGYSAKGYKISTDLYARYVRVEAALTGTDPVINATLCLNTYMSS